MVILVLLIAGVAILTLGVWAVARTEIGHRAVETVIAAPSRPLSWRLVRAALATAAALLAMIAAARLADDRSIELEPAASLFFVAEAAVAAVTAVALARRRLASARVLGVLAVGLGGVGLATSPLSLARSACACARPVIPYVPPTWLGLDAATWAAAALVGVPILLGIALLPWRR